mmetsp:Transcript_1925/g.11968  ORF Transcript_1925/g.11968 Transcript_1925/m.11968 type:complete len:300 (-) Transcript_1925:1600-2499(-)
MQWRDRHAHGRTCRACTWSVEISMCIHPSLRWLFASLRSCSTPSGTASVPCAAPTWSSSHVTHVCTHASTFRFVSFRSRAWILVFLLLLRIAEPARPPCDVGVVPTPLRTIASPEPHVRFVATLRLRSAVATHQRQVLFGASRECFVVGRGRAVRLSHPRKEHVRFCRRCVRDAVAEGANQDVEKAGAAVTFLRWYKAAVSPLLPPSCRYVPTCSEYAVQAFATYGWTRGAIMTTWRLARCQPFGGSGYDPATWESTPFAKWWPVREDAVEEVEDAQADAHGEGTCDGTSQRGGGSADG